MSGTPTIRASVFAPIIAELEAMGFKPDILLADNGLVREHLRDPYAIVSLPRYISFFEKASTVFQISTLGALLGTRVTPGDLGPTGLLFAASPTILDGLNSLTRYISAIQGATSCAIHELEGNSVWSYQIAYGELGARKQDAEFTLSVCCQLIRSSFARNWTPLELHFEHPEANAATLGRLFRAPIKFGQSRNRIIIRHSDAVRVHRTEDPALRLVLERHLAELMEEPDEPQTMTARVCALVALNLGQSDLSIAKISRDLELSPRTLQRRLRDEGTSLRNIVEGYRREITQKQIGTSMRKQHIAEMLGYSDTTAFWRARQRWK